jgi:hypothetical protein
MSSYCSIRETEFEPTEYKYIYTLINTRTNKKNYFSEQPIFAFNYDYLKIELNRVKEDSDEYCTSIANSYRLLHHPIIFKE